MHRDRRLLEGAEQAHEAAGGQFVGDLIRQEVPDAAAGEHRLKARLHVVDPKPSRDPHAATAPRPPNVHDCAVRKVPSTASWLATSFGVCGVPRRPR